MRYCFQFWRLLTIAALTLSIAAQEPAEARRDNRLHVGFLTPNDNAAAAALAPVLDQFSSNINKGEGYFNAFVACVLDAPAKPKIVNPCSNTASLDILVTTTIQEKDKATAHFPVSMVAGSLKDQHQTGNLTFESSSNATADLMAAVNALTLKQVQALFGNPVMNNGTLTLSSYSPFLQLVPETATDRKYADLLEHYLANQRIQFTPSQFTGLDASSPGNATPTDICQKSPRYLHYQVVIRQQPQPLFGQTVLFATGTGQVIDCADPAAPLTFKSFRKATITTSKGSFASIIGIITLLFVSKSNSWGNVAAVGNSTAGFIDTDPTSVTIEQRLYNESLRDLVDDMCHAIIQANARTEAEQQGKAFPSPETLRISQASGSAPPPATSSGTATNALGVGNLLVATQPPLICAKSPAPSVTSSPKPTMSGN